jgi:hypothetical protein
MEGKGIALKKKIKQDKEGLSQISFPILKKMATTNRLKDILKDHIESETIPSVRTAWIEYFLDIKNCNNPSKSNKDKYIY